MTTLSADHVAAFDGRARLLLMSERTPGPSSHRVCVVRRDWATGDQPLLAGDSVAVYLHPIHSRVNDVHGAGAEACRVARAQGYLHVALALIRVRVPRAEAVSHSGVATATVLGPGAGYAVGVVRAGSPAGPRAPGMPRSFRQVATRVLPG